MTSRCNISCVMCERRSNDFTLPRGALEEVVGFFPYLDSVMWQGGEVFIVDYFKELFLKASEHHQLIQEINTNGLLITEEWAGIIARGNTRLIFSIDSTDKDIYESIRKGAKFQDLIRNIVFIKEARQRCGKNGARDIINVVVMRSNHRHLDNFIEFAVKYGFRGLNFMYMLGNLCPEENIFEPGDKQAIAYLRQSMPRIVEEANTSGINVTYDFAPCLFDSEPRVSNNSSEGAHEGLFCSLPWRSLFIDGSQNGKIYPECICRIPIGNIFKDPLWRVWNNEDMQLYRKKIINRDLDNWCNPNCIKGIVNRNFLQSL